MSKTRRIIIAVIMALVFIGIGVAVFYPGFFLGGMATDSCDHLPGQAYLWLEVLWPVVMLASAIIPPILVIRQARWRFVLLAMCVGLLTSVGCYLSWFILLMKMC